jgi:hypothetical protein
LNGADDDNTDPFMENEQKTFLGMPYDWRPPTWERFKQRVWNPDDHRIFTPRVYGVGWTINIYEVARRLGLKH